MYTSILLNSAINFELSGGGTSDIQEDPHETSSCKTLLPIGGFETVTSCPNCKVMEDEIKCLKEENQVLRASCSIPGQYNFVLVQYT